jgi:hypothetical protein
MVSSDHPNYYDLFWLGDMIDACKNLFSHWKFNVDTYMMQIKGFVIQKNASNICKIYKYIGFETFIFMRLKGLASWRCEQKPCIHKKFSGITSVREYKARSPIR